MPKGRGNWGNSEQHRAAGRMSSGNRTRGEGRRGGRKRATDASEDSED